MLLKYLEIPFVWNNIFIEDISSLKVSELKLYGSIQNCFPTGRPNDYEFTNKEKIEQSFKIANKLGVKTNYLINGIITKNCLDEYFELFEWIRTELEPDYITISNSYVFDYFARSGNKNIEISAIAGIRNKIDFIKLNFDFNYIRSIVLHHDFSRYDKDESDEFIEFLSKNDIKPIILLTESCYYKCPYRQIHYGFIGEPQEGRFIDPFQIFCISKRIKHPESLLDLVGFLLPEQIAEYQNRTNISNFKISGRSKSPEWILNTTQAYINGQSPENLYEIIVFTSPFLEDYNMEIQDLFYLNSKAYFNLYYELIEIKEASLRANFLRQKAVELFKDGKLGINDPNSIYDIVNGHLVLIQKGVYLKRLEKELNDYLVSNNQQKLKTMFTKSYESIY